MTCQGCSRHNDPRRRYCGECGLDLQAPCVRCGFANELADKFCGGCGDAMSGAVSAGRPTPASAPVVARAVAPQVDVEMIGGADLTALIRESDAATAAVKAASTSLPEGQVTQDDLDSLFGAA